MFDQIITAVQFGDVATSVVAIAALIAVALVARLGARMVLDMLYDRQESIDAAEDEDRRREND